MEYSQTIEREGRAMMYKIGDTVVHWTYGLGTVVNIEEKQLGEVVELYYVVAFDDIRIWVLTEKGDRGSIRLPTESMQFDELFKILRMPGDELPDRYNKRKVILQERMHKWTLTDLCHLIRDLSDRSRMHTLSPYDSSVLLQAQRHLLDEWVFTLGNDRSSAMREMQVFLTPVAG